MASLLKASEKIQKGKKRAANGDEVAAGPSTVVEKKRKDKTLMLSSRGITGRMRHLMADIECLLPNIKKGES